MYFEADRHNFGKAVKVQSRASGEWFQKPRSIFWEFLFFGKLSPLNPFFNEIGSNGSTPLSKYLFNLEVEHVSAWSGMSREVVNQSTEATLEHFYGFGVLLAYSYLFGIRDLHKYNVVMTSSHLQAIDAEVVLTNLILPHETVLLPFKDVAFETSALSRLAPSIAEITQAQREQLFAGFIDLFEASMGKFDDLKQRLTTCELNDVPVRVIIRNTAPYREHLAGRAMISDILPEEKNQLDRGDIPYFCKFLGDDALYWVASSTYSLRPVADLGPFLADVHRHAMPPDVILGSPAQIKQKLVHGLLFLQRKMGICETRFQLSHRSLNLSESQLTFSNPAECFKSLRQ